MEKLRIINDATGEVKHVTAQVAKNASLLKSYGFRVQDLGEKTKVLGSSINISTDNPRERYKELFGKYPAGRMKPETIAIKIQEAETKLN